MNAPRGRSWLSCVLLAAGSLAAQDVTVQKAEIDSLMEQRKFDEALPLVTQALADHGDTAELLHLRGVCEGQLGQHEKAIATETSALALDADYGPAYGERAYNLYRLRRLDEALADYTSAAALDPESPMVHGERGDLLLELGRLREAIAAFDRAIEIAPKWLNAHSQRGLAAARLGDHVESHRSFSRTLEINPKARYSYGQLAEALFELHREDEALAELQRGAREHHSYWMLMLRGRLALRLRRYDIAREELTKVTARGDAPSQTQARISLASLHLAEGAPEDALEALDYEVPEQLAGYAPWFELMRWCAERRLLPAERAAANLRAAVAALPDVDPLVRSLVSTCIDETPPALPVAGETDLMHACPQLFFAAWRAIAEGDDELADDLLLQCVNTGRAEYRQWVLAHDLLLRRLGEQQLEVHPGMEFDVEVDPVSGARLAVVRTVATNPPGAAAFHGLLAGDVIEQVAEAPYDPTDWQRLLPTLRPGSLQHLTVRRGDEHRKLAFRLGICKKPG